MPIYEYRRPDGTTFDVVQKFSDDALTVDPETGVPVEKVLHAPAIHFKGSGFHNTDYGTRRRNRELEKAGSGEGGSSAEGSSSSDAKGGTDAGSGSKDTASSSSSEGSSGSGSGSSSSSSDAGAAAKPAKPKADKAA